MIIKWVGSPNFDSNRKPITTIVIHWIVGTLAAADAVFAKPKGAAAHYAIENGEVHQYVKEEHVAYHAGNYAMNQRSIGIEHSAAPDRPASEETYKTSAQLIAEICKRHNIPIDRAHIIKHSEVIATQCPGTINIDKLISMAIEYSKPPYIPIQIDKKTFEELVGKSSQWDKIADYLKIDRRDAVGGDKAVAAYKKLETEKQDAINRFERLKSGITKLLAES